MHLQVTDGKAELASFAITLDDDSTILCFSQEELIKQKAILGEAGATYTVETVTWSDEQYQIIAGKFYASADEARQDLNGTRQPTEMEMFQNELKHKDEEIAQMKAESADTTAMLLELYEVVYPTQ